MSNFLSSHYEGYGLINATTLATIDNHISPINPKLIQVIIIEKQNCWDMPLKLDIFECKQGTGLIREIPDGYGTYTYDPMIEYKIYNTKDLNRFALIALIDEERPYFSKIGRVLYSKID